MLKIEEIELRDFSGMWLNNVKYFKLSIVALYTLILGRNGSGKSRLIAMMNLLAPSKADFAVGGGRKLTVLYNGERFSLESEHLSKGMIHNIRNLTTGEIIGEAINSAHYNEYVSEKFQYRNDIHELLTGRIGLTSMSKSERRYWFSQLSESDLSYALSFHAKAKKNLRDIEGAIASHNRDIAALRVRVVEDKDEYAALEKRLAELQSDMATIDKELAYLGTANYSEEDLDGTDAEIKAINRKVQQVEIYKPSILIDFEVATADRALGLHIGRRDGHLHNIEDLTNRIDKAKRIRETVDAEAVIDNIAAIRKQIVDIEDTIGCYAELLDADGGDLHEASNALKRLLSLGGDLCRAYNVDFPTDGLMEREKVLSDSILEMGEQAGRMEMALHRLGAQLQAVKQAAAVTCPKCTHEFKPGVKEGEQEHLTKTIAQGEARLSNLKEKMVEAGELIEQYRAIIIAQRQFMDEVSRYDNPVVHQFVSLLHGDVGLGENSILRIPLLAEFASVVEKACTIDQLKNKLASLEQQMIIIEATAAEDMGKLQELLEFEQRQYSSALWNIKELTHLKTVHAKYVESQQILDNLESDLVGMVERRSVIIDDLIKKEKIDALNAHGQELWELYCGAKIRFDAMANAKAELASLEKRLDYYNKRLAAATHVVKVMSPETGLLAKYLYQCITRITDLMTAYIGKIWGYQVKICPCDVSDGDLDYRFPYWIDNPEKKLADVSLGSKGQREVIDFVFVLAVYKALKLDKYPLFIDELGSGFDEGHRASAVDFVSSQVDRGAHSQLLMVSHDAATHFQLTNADITVLDPSGISLPKVYNTNTTIR